MKIFEPVEFSKREFIVIMFLASVLITAVGIKYAKDNHWYLKNSEAIQDNNGKDGYRIDINNAGWQELMLLSRIGEMKAKAIVKYRDENGSFNSVDELSNIEGIGDKTLNSIKDMIVVNKSRKDLNGK